MAEPKIRLVERAGGKPVGSIEQGIEAGARLAFVALDDPRECERAAERLRQAGMLVNVVDRPELCDFTTPSILDRDPVLIAVGTDGASAGLAKQLRLRLETLLPQSLGALAARMRDMREEVRRKWPSASDRRQAVDDAFRSGGPLDPLDDASAGRVSEWLGSDLSAPASRHVEIVIESDDPDDLTLRQARLLGGADVVVFDTEIAPAILDRARADARRVELSQFAENAEGLVLVLRRN